ncbi:hypothetical protein OpiT1DRAFT_03993 [Opitutaceae bacterium TAV1]|nr:hypothetical protein OpiT1DRAFT_03993 [Opitutaceae bacterium TAV1]
MKNQVKKSAGVKPVFEIATVTPETASEWLKRNEGNRRLSPVHVKRLAQEMRAGRWALGNDAITFDANGRLVNGQHRLTAVRESGMAAQFAVLRGVSPSARDVMDMGHKRSLGDMLTLNHGVKDGLAVAAISNILALASPSDLAAGTATHALYLLSRYREAFDWVQEVMGRRRSFFTHASVLAALVIGRHHFPEETAAFHAALINPVNVPPSRNAVLKLRDLATRRFVTKDRVPLFFKACNALWSFIRNEEVKALLLTEAGYRALRANSPAMVPNTKAKGPFVLEKGMAEVRPEVYAAIAERARFTASTGKGPTLKASIEKAMRRVHGSKVLRVI